MRKKKLVSGVAEYYTQIILLENFVVITLITFPNNEFEKEGVPNILKN